MGKINLMTENQGLWVAKEGQRLGVSSVVFQNNRDKISAFLANLSPFIFMNRSQPLIYPNWVDKPLYPELEVKGPKKVDVSKLEHWLHPEQEQWRVKGTVIHGYLKENNLLPTCLGLYELLAIQAKGLDFYRRYFQNKAVFGWKGGVRLRGGCLRVPCLVEGAGKVVLRWGWLELDWGADGPALRLAK